MPDQTAPPTIDILVDNLIAREGGFVDHPADRGGPTNWGITEAVARAHGYTGPMALLPRGEAAAIYRRLYWLRPRFDAVARRAPHVAAELFDTAVNAYLASRGALDLQGGGVIGLVVETGCAFFAPAAFPETLSVGVRVAHLGRSSVRYELAVFREGEDTACAQGHFVHVYVDRETRRPTELPAAFRAALEGLRVS